MCVIPTDSHMKDEYTHRTILTDSYQEYDYFMSESWLIRRRNVTHSCVYLDSAFILVPWLSHIHTHTHTHTHTYTHIYRWARSTRSTESKPNCTLTKSDAGASSMYYLFACCSVLQCVAVCCRVVQCVAVCRSVLQSQMPALHQRTTWSNFSSTSFTVIAYAIVIAHGRFRSKLGFWKKIPEGTRPPGLRKWPGPSTSMTIADLCVRVRGCIVYCLWVERKNTYKTRRETRVGWPTHVLSI